MKAKMADVKLGVFSLLLGAAAGAVIWLLMMGMVLGMKVVWQIVPACFQWSHSLAYDLTVCLAGGVLIAWVRKRSNSCLEPMFSVFARVKREGGYPYHQLQWMAAAFLLPIVFGGAIGPAAGLTGFIAGVWTLICACLNGRLKHPVLFKKVENLSGRRRIVLYSLGALSLIIVLSGLLGAVGGIHLPRFRREHAIGWGQWKWALVLIALGIFMALLYTIVDELMARLAKKLMKHRTLMCVVTGGIVGMVVYFLPNIPFAGDTQLSLLFSQWTSYTVGVLVLAALLKMLLTVWCLNFGWRGGNFFPLIFAGTAVAYAFTLFAQNVSNNCMLDQNFAAALVVSAMIGFLVKKPLPAVVVLLFCFPLTYIFPLTVAVLVAGKLAVIVERRKRIV